MRKVLMDDDGVIRDEETGIPVAFRNDDGSLEISEEAKSLRDMKAENGTRPDSPEKQGTEADGIGEGQLKSESATASPIPDSPYDSSQSLPPNQQSPNGASMQFIPIGGPTLMGIKPRTYSKYEVRPDSSFTIRFCLCFVDDRAIVLDENAKVRNPEAEAHWVRFRMWRYAEEMEWKGQCQEFDGVSRMFKTNAIRLDELKIRHLIRDWSFAEYDERFKLLHVGGVLSDESFDMFKGFFPTIINHIIYMMNQVLENDR